MILPPRQLFVRLVFWAAILVWAIWKLRDLQDKDLAVPDFFGPMPSELVSPLVVSAAVAEPGDAPDLVDPERAMAALQAAIAASAECGAGGTLVVTLGEGGLEAASVRGPAGPDARACVERALGAVTWPKTKMGFEVEGALAGEAPPHP